MAGLGKRVLLTYGGGSIRRIGLYDIVKELLKDFEITELPGIQPNPKYDPSVLEGVRLCKDNHIDVILSVGGGSVLDCSKAIAAGALYDGNPWDLITYKVKARAALPVVDIGDERLDEMARHIAENEGLGNAYVPLTEKDIREILVASL